MQLQGIISGKHIELFNETNLPDGSLVIVNIQPKPLPLKEKRRLIDKLCGSWANDTSLESIFEEIKDERNKNKPREVHFDMPS